MNVYKYFIELIDPIFSSKEGLSAATTPSYLHATAINHAVAYGLGKGINQPYIISEENGGRNIPRYESSQICPDFYFTPARIDGNITYQPQIVKGDADGFLNKGGPAEVLRSSTLYFLSPENNFTGYVFTRKELAFPKIIRLGSFRGKAKLKLREVKIYKEISEAFVSHPVDPLVNDVLRGVMVNMFPYPLVENSYCRNCIIIKEGRSERIVSMPQNYEIKSTDILSKSSNTMVF